jgi:hypothetical protein
MSSQVGDQMLGQTVHRGDLRAELLALGVVRTSGESKRQEARTLALVAARRRERDAGR